MKPAVTKSFLLFLALLVGAELVVRGFFARGMSGRFDYGYHPTAGFVEQADGVVRLERTGGRRFFPQKFTRDRAADTYRIFVVGDSVPRGTSVGAAYGGRLAEELRTRGVKTESYNLCLPGFGVRRKHLVLEQALKYQPNLIILHVNDSNEYEDEREWNRREEFKGWQPKNWLMKSLALRRLYEMKQERVLWEWLPAGIRNQRATSDADARLQASMNDAKVQAWTKLVREQTGADVALARQHGARVLLVSHAVAEWEQPHPVADDHGLDALCEALAGDGVAAVSLKRVFAGQDARKVYSDGSHLRPESHQFLAQALAAKLMELGWVQPGK